MDSADLQKRFHLGEAPDEDLRIVLAFHFDTCGKLTGPGLREQFVAFLERFAPPHPDEPGTERDALYHLRSKLSHGGGLLIAEESQAFGDFYPKANVERNRVWIAGLLVRLAGISWLAQDGD